MYNKKYKLIEITPEEFEALRDAGVWVQWNLDGTDGVLQRMWTSLVDPHHLLKAHPKAKFYARIDLDANLDEDIPSSTDES